MAESNRIFISCVSSEFRTYRTSLRTALTSAIKEIKIQEDFQDGSATLLRKLDLYITRCQAVIHLVGSSTGEKAKPAEIRWLLETYPDFASVMLEIAQSLDPDACPFTYTQWECFLALYHRVPCFIYLAGSGSEREPGWVEDLAAAVEQADHVHRLRSLGHDRRIMDFADPRDIALRFLSSLFDEGGQEPALAARLPISWPVIASASSYRLADRETEFSSFRALLSADSQQRILTVHGPSDRGKSALLGEFFRFIRNHGGIQSAYAEFKTSLPLTDVLRDLRRDLAGIRFPRFERIKDNGSLEMLRAAFIHDIEESPSPVVLILDAYEQATDEARQWVENRLAPLCDTFAGLRVIIGGKTVPDFQSSVRLAARTKCVELPPISDPTHWCDFGRRVLGLRADALPDDHIGTLVTAAQGSPRVLSTLLTNLKPPVGCT